MIVGTVAFVGCGDGGDAKTQPATPRAERKLMRIVESDTGAQIKSVTYPDDFNSKVGETYAVKALTTSGKTYVVLLKYLGEGDDSVTKVTPKQTR